MNIEEFREYCLTFPAVTEGFPFGEEILVFKVLDKVFALSQLYKDEFKVNLKCDADYAVQLREEYEAVQPGYHMNKKYWNTVEFESGLPEKLLKKLIKHSYDEVVKKLTKKQKTELQNFVS